MQYSRTNIGSFWRVLKSILTITPAIDERHASILRADSLTAATPWDYKPYASKHPRS